MDWGNFFGQFEAVTEAPGGIDRLRKLVLELAVRGKLVPQVPKEAPASTFLTAIHADRTQAEKASEHWCQRTLPRVKDHEKYFPIPGPWEWARLGTITHDWGQVSPSTKFSYIDVSSIDSHRGRLKTKLQILEPQEAPTRARKLTKPGSVIYSTVRPYLLNVAIVEQEIDPAPIASTAFSILHPCSGILNRYLFHFLRSATFNKYVAEQMRGVAYPAINQAKLLMGPVPVPPTAEQHRIVTRIDELMGLCDELETKQKYRFAIRRNLRDASLEALAQAETPEGLAKAWRRVHERFPEVVKLDSDVGGLREALLELAYRGFLSRSGSSWGFKPLAELLQEDLRNGRSAKDDPAGQPILRLTAFRSKMLDFSSHKLGAITANELREFAVQNGDFFVVRGNGSLGLVGRGSLAGAPPDLIAFPDLAIRIRPNRAKLDPSFLAYLWDSPSVRRQIETAARTTSGIYKISQNDIKVIRLPTPDLQEQSRTIAKLDRYFKLCAHLEARLGEQQRLAEDLGTVATLTLAR